MTWGEIQIESLKKMFLNKTDLSVSELSNYMTNKDYRIYLFAMPQACNEAINYIVTSLGSKQKISDLRKTSTDALYDLETEFNDFGLLTDIICGSNVIWKMRTDNIVQITNWISDQPVKVQYSVKPTIITNETLNTQTIEIKDEYARLIPLYIAGELYKDDDLSMATMYMNEFMTNINALAYNVTPFNPTITSVYTAE